jgi:hypothetical protein
MVHFADQDTIVRIDTLANNFDPRTVVPVLAWPYKAGRRNRFRPSAYRLLLAPASAETAFGGVVSLEGGSVQLLLQISPPCGEHNHEVVSQLLPDGRRARVPAPSPHAFATSKEQWPCPLKR